MDRADGWFSRFIRIKHSILIKGIFCCRCYTCQKLLIIKNIDCGHYINRPHHTVRWDIDNARPQCKQCNYYRSGEHYKFEQNLMKEIGQRAVDALKQRANQIANYSVEDIRDIAKKFRLSVRSKEEELSIKIWN